MSPVVTPDIVKNLAPSGTLKATINLGNMVLAQGTPDAPSGITVDISRELARRLSVPVEFYCFDQAGKAFEGFRKQNLDIAFLAIEPVRAAEIEFTAPYVLIEGVYMVPNGSPLNKVEEVDAKGMRIAVAKDAAYDLFLTRSLKNATLVRGPESFERLSRGEVDVAAGVKQPVVAYAKAHPEVRVLDGRFMEIRQAMGTQKGRDIGAHYLKAFIEDLKTSGFIAAGLKRSNQPEATVAPPA